MALWGCSGQQSALEPSGEEAASVAQLFWAMVGGGAVIWIGLMALLATAIRGKLGPIDNRAATQLVFWGGAVLPSAALVGLLGYALWLMPGLRPFANSGAPQVIIEVTGRQFWWDVIYRLPDGVQFRTANEIVLPVGQRVEFSLKSTDVIHSFWIPSLAGKVDMIPGRTNRLSLVATKEGRFRGPCAEYCGTSHAFMAVEVTSLPVQEFALWTERRRQPSPGILAPGSELFEKHGCGSCHRVEGTSAASRVGPDLSHLGSRNTLGAGILPNTPETISSFIVRPDAIKPGTHMPAFDMLPPDDIRSIAVWLKGLE
ncbi:cytochrome B [Aminobacter sp. DSM 101952]|nr:cytochrome B [Aminobacter sp. DSM 101952]